MNSLKTVVTELPPCTLSKCGSEIVVGTYDLNKETGVRTGSLVSYSPDLEHTPEPRKQELCSSAVLDSRVHGTDLFTAHSTGEVRVFDFDLHQKHCIQLSESEHLVTQIALNGPQLLAVLTTGELIAYDLESQTETYRAKNHDLEAWCVVSDGGSLVYTGGDDRSLVATDLRIPYTLFKIKPHEAGLTSILPRDGQLWTGGYDDRLNFVDLRSKRVLASHDLGGGVWRLIPNESDSKVLACCMYGGLKVLDTKAEVLGSLTNHESMVYGGLWLDNTQGVTCSFYDKMLQKWDTN